MKLAVHDPRTVGFAESAHGGFGPGHAAKLVDEQLAKGVQIEDKPIVRRAISTTPVVKPIRVNAPELPCSRWGTFAKS